MNSAQMMAQLPGLSPLARGTLIDRILLSCFYRFIPAGAGNTQGFPATNLGMTVYPRWRGEHANLLRLRPILRGLSPLARGTPDESGESVDRHRFIPAGAGNTHAAAWAVGAASVYPRWRGEHGLKRKRRRSRTGLSPLARGTRLRLVDEIAQRRFIPAGAGNTMVGAAAMNWKAVYPRWRGEHICTWDRGPIVFGLSPLARGTHYVSLDAMASDRFIPAGAGNTSFVLNPRHQQAVYPRWRGEHKQASSCAYVPIGLSPLARGTR